MQVFCDQKAAGEDRQFSSSASVSKAMINGTVSSGHYFMLWKDCSPELQSQYLEHNDLPPKRVNGMKIQVLQLHPVTETVVKIHSCIEDVLTEFKLSRRTLKIACEYNNISKGYRWKFVKNTNENEL
jgi:hypothetical protein